MDKKKVQYAAPVKPFEESVWDRWSMYDNMPYVWDPDLGDTKRFTLESGNIIKAYRCLITEPFEVKH